MPAVRKFTAFPERLWFDSQLSTKPHSLSEGLLQLLANDSISSGGRVLTHQTEGTLGAASQNTVSGTASGRLARATSQNTASGAKPLL